MRKGKNEINYKIKNDNYNTPIEAFQLIFKYVDKTKRIWMPFYNDGSLSNHLETLGVNYIHSNTDFFTYEPDFEILIDNPPYSIKQKVFERCIALDKPFALLVPMDTLDRQYFSRLFKDKDITIIIPINRYNFVSNEKKLTPPFKCIWICCNFKLDKQIIFE